MKNEMEAAAKAGQLMLYVCQVVSMHSYSKEKRQKISARLAIGPDDAQLMAEQDETEYLLDTDWLIQESRVLFTINDELVRLAAISLAHRDPAQDELLANIIADNIEQVALELGW